MFSKSDSERDPLREVESEQSNSDRFTRSMQQIWYLAKSISLFYNEILLHEN